MGHFGGDIHGQEVIQAFTTPHDLLDGLVHPDTIAALAARGYVIRGAASNKWDRLLANSVNAVLIGDGTDIISRLLVAGDIPTLPKSKIDVAGQWTVAEIPTLPKAKIDTTGQWLVSEIPSPLDSIARITHRKNSGVDIGSRRKINWIEGTNITLTVLDDAGSEETDVQINAAGGGAVNIKEFTVNLNSGTSEYLGGLVIDGSVSPASNIILGWANPPETDENTPNFLNLAFRVIPESGDFLFDIYSLNNERLRGTIRLQYLVG